MPNAAPPPPPPPPPKVLSVKITGSDTAIRELLTRHPMPVESTRRERDSVVIEVFVPEDEVKQLEHPGVAVQVLFDASARGRERQAEVGKGNRFAGEQRIPKGLGDKPKGGPQ